MFNRVVLTATVALLLAAVGCGADQEQAPEEEAAAPADTVAEETQIVEQTEVIEETTMIEDTISEATTPEVVSVGGFSIERPDGGETTVPQVSVQREDVQRYEEQVRPVVEDTVRDVSDLVQADVRFENGDLSFDVEMVSLEEARASVRDGLERVQDIDPPEDLEPIHQRLIEAYEQALPAYDEIIEAADSGDPQRMSAAVSENLPRIESFNEETRAVLQDLEQASGSQQ